MNKILIFGNSGSGKSTLASHLSTQHGYIHVDLDELAWLPPEPGAKAPERAPFDSSAKAIREFVEEQKRWVVEGCYTDLLEVLADEADQAVFLNLSVEDCINNARKRPWEPHKYDSKEAQDANLAMLLAWIRGYDSREGVFSRRAHQAFFDSFKGSRTEITDVDGLMGAF